MLHIIFRRPLTSERHFMIDTEKARSQRELRRNGNMMIDICIMIVVLVDLLPEKAHLIYQTYHIALTL